MRRIPLTKGHVALVDDEDYELLSGYSWSASVQPRTVYAVRDIWVKGTKKTVRMHRVVLGAQPGEEVDHTNHDGLDNRRANLRICSRSQNNGNRRKQQVASSRFKGVSWHKKTSKWQARIRLGGSGRHLGIFTDEIEAARAYDKAASFQWGEFACLNFPPASYAWMVAE